MAKRPRLSVEDVLQHFDDDYYDDDYLGDPDEPIMEGSDDKFSDLEGEDGDDGDNCYDRNDMELTNLSSSPGTAVPTDPQDTSTDSQGSSSNS